MREVNNSKMPGMRDDSRITLHVSRCILFLIVLASASPLFAAEVDVSKLPPPAKITVDFDRDVRPILERSCFRCHGPEKSKSGFRLDNRESALKGGDENSDDIVPGDSANSRLIHYVSGLVEDMEMPPPGKTQPLSKSEIGVLRAWIDQGAAWSANVEPKVKASFTPSMRWTKVEGNSSKFREVEGMNDRWSAGIGQYQHHERLSQDSTLEIDGYALFGDEKFGLTLALQNRDVGFVRAGFETWREFYDDVGGYAPSLPTNTFRLDRDLYLDVGRAWLDLGLTPPDGPEVVLGYEYQFRSGEKSTLQWGAVGTQPPFAPGTDARNVYPATKDIDEHTHIIKLDIRHELRGWELEDNARVEFYDLSASRQNVLWDAFGPEPNSVALVEEKYQHVSGANTLSVTKTLREWLTVSGGYLYSRLEGHGSLNVSTVDGAGNPAFGDQWQAGRIDVSRESQVVSVAGVAGPWSALVLSLGAQGEWTRQESVGNEDLRIGNPDTPPLFSDASPITGSLDSRSARENALLRWLGIPFTVVSVEARLRQEDLGRFEERPAGFDPFTRDTDAVILTQEYRAGFTTSPWSRWSFSGNFRHRDKQTDYTHDVFHPSGYLYPGFIVWRDIEENQVDARLTFRPNGWLQTSFDYQWRQSDYDSATGPVPFVSPGGPVEAARYQAHVYSLNLVLTPLSRLHVSAGLNYSDSHTATAQNGADYLPPWKGDVYGVISAVTFGVTSNTVVRGSYGFTQSDYGQNDQAALPLGIDYDRHALEVGVSHTFAANLSASAGYGFYQYREPTLGGAADYRAHAVFASATLALP